MILLDTNVVSEPMRLQPDPRVQIWLDAQAVLLVGIENLPTGKRRKTLAESLSDQIMSLFAGRIAATAYLATFMGDFSSGVAHNGMANIGKVRRRLTLAACQERLCQSLLL